LRRPLPLSGRLIRDDVKVPLLFGAASVSGETGRNLKYNSALLIGADDVIRDAYDKNLLIPFTEYVPFVDRIAALAARFADASEFSAGTDATPLRLGQWRIATPICHEIAQAAFVRRMVAAGKPHLIATLANDSWFGDSQEPWLHLAMARLRAVEHRRYLVRATNSGVSAVIDATGREVVRSGVLTRETLRAKVHMLDETSFYTAWGDWPGWVAVMVLVGGLLSWGAPIPPAPLPAAGRGNLNRQPPRSIPPVDLSRGSARRSDVRADSGMSVARP
jgi:apolipoprotein N-acyltransferase